MDLDESWNEQEENKVFGGMDWRDDSLATASVIKLRKISGTTYFSKGLLHELGQFIKDKEDINVVYVNTTLTSMQQKKLEKRFNDMINDNDDRMRRYFLKSAQKNDLSPTELESDTEISNMELTSEERKALQRHMQEVRKIRVIDRFGMILQIFAARAKHRQA